MATFDELIKQKLSLIDHSDNELLLASKNAQRQLWASIESDFDKIQLDGNGNIRLTEQNIKIAAEIVNKLKTGLGATDFRDAMTQFLQKFDQSLRLNEEIAKTFRSTYTISAAQKALIYQSKLIAIDLLTNQGYKSRIDQTLRIPLNAAIQSGATLRETIKSIKEVVQGTPNNDGRILANVRTYANTTFTTADRALSSSIYKDLGIEWYRYVGGEIDTTRDFCKQRNGKYFHKLEVQEWGNDEWSGQIDGTNSDNIFVFAGGWNCRHSIIPVTIRRVPQDVIDRAISKGYYRN
jgi:hypothetical protein